MIDVRASRVETRVRSQNANNYCMSKNRSSSYERQRVTDTKCNPHCANIVHSCIYENPPPAKYSCVVNPAIRRRNRATEKSCYSTELPDARKTINHRALRTCDRDTNARGEMTSCEYISSIVNVGGTNSCTCVSASRGDRTLDITQTRVGLCP